MITGRRFSCRSSRLSGAGFLFPLFSYSAIQLFSYSAIQLFSYSAIQLFSYSAIQLFSYSAIQLFSYYHRIRHVD
ncbi:hypothetical protein FML24_25560 [Klebsiella oxytoca]|nr:hypothetical protein [Klebsiella oxytoca]